MTMRPSWCKAPVPTCSVALIIHNIKPLVGSSIQRPNSLKITVDVSGQSINQLRNFSHNPHFFDDWVICSPGFQE